MNNPAFTCFERTAFHISENSGAKEYESERGDFQWTENEIEAIRVVLQKLTKLRIMNISDAEDLVQDTLLTMIMKHPGNKLEKGLLVWSMGILRKKVGNYYRKVRRQVSFHKTDAGEQKQSQQSNQTTTPEMDVSHKELRAIIDETLAQFPPLQRQAMELLIAGFKTGEIVKRLQPERYQNVINRLHRGRRKLAKELAKYGYGPNPRTVFRKSRPRKH